MTYPIEEEGVIVGFRIGVYDSNNDLWWFSPDTNHEEKELEVQASVGWKNILEDFLERQDEFTDGTQVVDVRSEIKAEIMSAEARINQLEDLIGVDNESRISDTEPTATASGGEQGEEPEEGSPTEDVQPEPAASPDGEGSGSEGEGVGDDKDSQEPEHDSVQGEADPEPERELSEGGGDNPIPQAEGTAKSKKKSRKAASAGSSKVYSSNGKRICKVLATLYSRSYLTSLRGLLFSCVYTRD